MLLRSLMPVVLMVAICWPGYGDKAAQAEALDEDVSSSEDLEAEDATPSIGVMTADQEARIDRASERVAQNVNALARRIDEFFVDDPLDDVPRDSRVRVRLGLTANDEGDLEFDPTLRINIDIPQTEQRLNLFIASFSENEEKESQRTIRKEKDDAVGLGLRYLVVDSPYHQVSFSGGVGFRPSPDPLGRVSYSTGISQGRWACNPAQYFFWSLDEGFGERTRFDVEWTQDEFSFVRNRTQVTHSERTVREGSNVEFDNFLGHYTELSKRRAIRFSYGFLGEVEPSTVITEHVIATMLRQAFYRTILFYEIEPAIRFKRDDEYEPLYELTFRIEINFSKGDLAAPKTEETPR